MRKFVRNCQRQCVENIGMKWPLFSRDSEELLEATLDLDAQAVAEGIEKNP